MVDMMVIKSYIIAIWAAKLIIGVKDRGEKEHDQIETWYAASQNEMPIIWKRNLQKWRAIGKMVYRWKKKNILSSEPLPH